MELVARWLQVEQRWQAVRELFWLGRALVPQAELARQMTYQLQVEQ